MTLPPGCRPRPPAMSPARCCSCAAGSPIRCASARSFRRPTRCAGKSCGGPWPALRPHGIGARRRHRRIRARFRRERAGAGTADPGRNRAAAHRPSAPGVSGLRDHHRRRCPRVACPAYPGAGTGGSAASSAGFRSCCCPGRNSTASLMPWPRWRPAAASCTTATASPRRCRPAGTG